MEAKKSASLYFEPKRVGEDLSEVALELLKVESQQVESRWFHSQFETDLFLWSDQKGNVIKQQISFYGQIVEWNFLEGVRTGVVLEEEVAGAAAKPSETVRFDQLVSGTTVGMAIEIVQNIKNIKHDLREKIIENFLSQKPRSIQKNEPQSFIDKIKSLFQKE